MAIPPPEPPSGNNSLPHPRALAFLGDAVFELFLREKAVALGFSQSNDLHQFTTQRAKAAAQASLLHALQPLLTTQEAEWVRQGRNLTVASGKRFAQAEHRMATAWEVLVGALHLQDTARLQFLFNEAGQILFSPDYDASKAPEQNPDPEES